MFLRLVRKSLGNRKGSITLTLMAMTVSILVLFAVEHIRYNARESFTNTVSGIDLIVGARTGSLNLLLYSVFRIGSPTKNIDWASYKKFSVNPKVKWAVPIMLGDSHRGYRVMGTTRDYFKYFRYGKQHHLHFDGGKAFNNTFDIVLGADIARKLGYSLGDKLTLSHGVGRTSFSHHDQHPFTVVGILSPTGTPVDQTLHVSLAGIEAIHDSAWNSSAEPTTIEPQSITAFMVGLKSRLAIFGMQRAINQYEDDPLLAILPGVALTELWQMMHMLENTLLLIATLVFIAALLGLSAMLLSSISNRNREIQLLRVIGASPAFLFWLIQVEALIIAGVGILLGSAVLSIGLHIAQDTILSYTGLQISSNIMVGNIFYYAMAIILATFVVASIPSLIAYSKAKSMKSSPWQD